MHRESSQFHQFTEPHETAIESMDYSDTYRQVKTRACQQGDQTRLAHRSRWVGGNRSCALQDYSDHSVAWSAKRWWLVSGSGL